MPVNCTLQTILLQLAAKKYSVGGGACSWKSPLLSVTPSGSLSGRESRCGTFAGGGHRGVDEAGMLKRGN